MKEKPWSVLVISVILHCFGEVDAHSVRLVPSPIAEVEEKNTLILQCSYYGSNAPEYINWYLNNDTHGLVIDSSSCRYESYGKYEIDRYNKSCVKTNFSLSIANISKDKDDQAIWKCDTTVIGKSPPQKASTRIVVTDAGPADTKSGQFDESKTVVVVTVVVAGVIAANIVAGYFLYRKRRNDRLKKINEDHDEDQDHDEDHQDDHHEDYDDDLKQMGTRLKIITLRG